MHDLHAASFEPDSTPTDHPRTTAVGLEAWLSGTYAHAPAPVATVAAPKPEVPVAPEPEPQIEPMPEIGPVNAAEALVLDAFTGARKLVSADGAELIVDPGLKTYYFEFTTLKPLASLLHQSADRWIPVYTKALDATRAAYPAQPLERLRWFAGLVSTPGILARRLQRDQRYKLQHWPETEREFPRHFRIARAMLKDPLSIEQIVHASGASHAEVIDYVNASHAANRLEAAPAAQASTPAPDAEHTPRKGRLMSRLDPRRLAR